ncbi:hypothetical protein CO058_00120 [candidate division WWE3 bacterium CG_4_9_14_0_2_um_filter_35_11]|uniref:Uncharacterized protein n=1 Tax=candidate division WWE3 bacterium CG_4_9_14_0_2_um_filter_35_11 TaxID=1975077 RepID=A0A2M8EN15_UNCKA|nr:MAG: hypothetical protein CO058_00120 [candidate division WWE3 bacterium CG_4_9_14_0_2_um_filter_35_11]
MKHFNLTDLARFNLKLIGATLVLHWLSFYDEALFNPMFTRSIMLRLGFHTAPYILFGLAGIFFFMIFFVYIPIAIFDLFVSKLSTRFTDNITISATDMKFKKSKHIENLIRLIIYALICLTPYLFVDSIINTVIILPFTFFHMILMAITTFTHGIQILTLYRILRSKLTLAI